ncbi:MAG: hypothetical protein KGO50_07740 [Myxococcales bacterium]|nr:hypothetical protein [Myxococcales bacterium]
MNSSLLKPLQSIRDALRISQALSRGAATASTRQLNLMDLNSWEFSGFSQNGEDGVIEVLLRHLGSRNRSFIEIGAADAHENNSSWRAIAHRESGLMVEGSPELALRATSIMNRHAHGVRVLNRMVTPEHAASLLSELHDPQVDLFSLDIDSVDYWVADALLRAGFRPSIVVVEYNSTWGPDLAVTVPQSFSGSFRDAHPSHLYFGASLSAWKSLWGTEGYRFLGVERNGVNAFFVLPERFESSFVLNVQGLLFAENYYQRSKFRTPWHKQYELIGHLPTVTISP